jgi:hypothetical protein
MKKIEITKAFLQDEEVVVGEYEPNCEKRLSVVLYYENITLVIRNQDRKILAEFTLGRTEAQKLTQIIEVAIDVIE